jgi:hypothetical protein
MQTLEVVKAVHDLAPAAMDTISALVALCTSLQAVLLVAGKWSTKAAAVAHWLGIAAVDLKQFGEGVKKATGKATDALKGSNVAIVMLLALFLGGCAGSLGPAQTAGAKERSEKIGLKFGSPPPPSAYCQSIDSQRSTLGFFGKLTAGSATVAAGSVAYWQDERSDNIAALTAASLAAISVALFSWSDDKDTTHAKDCPQ